MLTYKWRLIYINNIITLSKKNSLSTIDVSKIVVLSATMRPKNNFRQVMYLDFYKPSQHWKGLFTSSNSQATIKWNTILARQSFRRLKKCKMRESNGTPIQFTNAINCNQDCHNIISLNQTHPSKSSSQISKIIDEHILHNQADNWSRIKANASTHAKEWSSWQKKKRHKEE